MTKEKQQERIKDLEATYATLVHRMEEAQAKVIAARERLDRDKAILTMEQNAEAILKDGGGNA